MRIVFAIQDKSKSHLKVVKKFEVSIYKSTLDLLLTTELAAPPSQSITQSFSEFNSVKNLCNSVNKLCEERSVLCGYTQFNSSRFFRNTEGANPVCFLNALMNVDLELKPDKLAK